MNKLRVLIACEESQAVCTEFRNLGDEAYSCDLQPCSGGHPEWHIQGDVLPLLKEQWDLIIAHPPCTYLTVTGNRWFNVERYGNKALERVIDREKAIDFFLAFTNLDVPAVAIENPVGCMSTRWRKPDQYIQPYEYGDAYEKKTCLWLIGLPKLQPTNIVKPEARIYYASGKSMPAWYCKASGPDRSKIRSKTFPGIARAMAQQWHTYIIKKKEHV